MPTLEESVTFRFETGKWPDIQSPYETDLTLKILWKPEDLVETNPKLFGAENERSWLHPKNLEMKMLEDIQNFARVDRQIYWANHAVYVILPVTTDFENMTERIEGLEVHQKKMTEVAKWVRHRLSERVSEALAGPQEHEQSDLGW
ncbi:hypothetical protein [Rhodococcus opacus]|uniref:hypothetical protein n=1 Tax=Rhodococcus opacus TaxID=37919 RepID=UPI00155A5C47|nr:hypothetical protein [Rhodococcus opacus]